jgi:succinyl-CoA synthetase beta subunit
LEVRVPLVIRLQGTNVDAGRALLRQANALNLISVEELGEAARKVVELAGKV